MGRHLEHGTPIRSLTSLILPPQFGQEPSNTALSLIFTVAGAAGPLINRAPPPSSKALKRPGYNPMGMAYHPKAYLIRKRNVRPGLDARTKIIMALEEEPGLTMARIAEKTGLSYSSVRLHMASLEEEGVVARKGKRPYSWFLTGLGQARLTDF